MAGLVPAIHVARNARDDVDARDKPGHDGGERGVPQLRPVVTGPGSSPRTTAEFAPPCPYRGRSVRPIRNLSMAWAQSRPSRIAHTTSDWPRRMSPAANTFGTDV